MQQCPKTFANECSCHLSRTEKRREWGKVKREQNVPCFPFATLFGQSSRDNNRTLQGPVPRKLDNFIPGINISHIL